MPLYVYKGDEYKGEFQTQRNAVNFITAQGRYLSIGDAAKHGWAIEDEKRPDESGYRG